MGVFRKLKNYLKSVYRTANKTGQTGFAKVQVMLDIISCRIRFGCSCRDYDRYQFYKYKNLYRKNFIADHHLKLIRKWTGNVQNKWEDYQCLKDLISRQILLLPDCGAEAFAAFLKHHRKVVVKPCSSRAGVGMRILEYTNDEDALAFFSSLKEIRMCEEYVYQHPVIGALNPSSLNTLRIVTLLDGDKFTILSAALKMGSRADSIADNLHQNGIAAGVHLDTGIVHTFGRDYADHVYAYHPVSGTQIIGLQVPHWEQVKVTLQQAHFKMHAKPYIGWDVAITQTGVEIIEANVLPGHVTMQFFDQIPKGKPVLEQAKRSLRKK